MAGRHEQWKVSMRLRAFTLLEVLLVLFIVGMLIAFAFPDFERDIDAFGQFILPRMESRRSA